MGVSTAKYRIRGQGAQIKLSSSQAQGRRHGNMFCTNVRPELCAQLIQLAALLTASDAGSQARAHPVM